ncbi:hypothetical protein K8R14_01620 [bacterium]|nr:hypothetical protein [bacterium]
MISKTFIQKVRTICIVMVLVINLLPIDAGATNETTREAIDQFKLWIKVFRGDYVFSDGYSFSGRMFIHGDDVMISDPTDKGPLTYAYPVPVQSSIIGITQTGAMIIRLSPHSIPTRFLSAIPAIKSALLVVNSTPGLQQRPLEDLGMRYARILQVMVNHMER